MKCPVDKSVLMVVEHRKIELDYCLKCSGVWLDAGELELLISVLRSEGANLSDSDLLAPNKSPSLQAKRRCPICGRKMDKIWMGNSPKVLIDSCPEGDGLWFDRGELQRIIHEMEVPGSVGSPNVVTFLGEAFKATHKHGVKQ
jgi:Zn-finger nucleic acid-binding protein